MIIVGKSQGSSQRRSFADRGIVNEDLPFVFIFLAGARPHVRPSAPDSSAVDTGGVKKSSELKHLRFSHFKTAFDVDIDSLSSHGWRSKNADLTDYFNYGFNEKTWMV